MLYSVHHYNFGTTYHFASLEEAKAYAIRANFEAVIYSAANSARSATTTRIATYSPISGWRVV